MDCVTQYLSRTRYPGESKFLLCHLGLPKVRRGERMRFCVDCLERLFPGMLSDEELDQLAEYPTYCEVCSE